MFTSSQPAGEQDLATHGTIWDQGSGRYSNTEQLAVGDDPRFEDLRATIPERNGLEGPSVSRPVVGSFYRPELDALRFLAFVLVFMHHKLPLGRLAAGRESSPLIGALQGAQACGSYGVSLFFLLSSFLITELLLREVDQKGCLSVGQFYMRRVLRIWPLYFSVIGIAVLLGMHRVTPYVTHFELLTLAVFVFNMYEAMHGFAMSWISNLWSISVE